MPDLIGRAATAAPALIGRVATAGAAAVVAVVALLAAGCSDDQPDRPAGALSADQCEVTAIALDAERNSVDLEYQIRLDEWLTLESEGETLDIEWAALKDPEAALDPKSGDSDLADDPGTAQIWDSAKALTSDWERLETEWVRTEAKLEVFIDAAADAPPRVGWPLDPRRHSDRWPDLFQHRADLNDEWSTLAADLADLFRQMSDLYGQAAAATPDQTSPQADLALTLSNHFERRAALYDRYASSTVRWADHWRFDADWHQQATDLAWNHQCPTQWFGV